MTEQHAQDPAPSPEEIPEAAIEEKRGLSLVWLIPLLAVAIGGWLVFKAIAEKGPTITITFTSAADLQPGKTKIKFKDVEIGEVTTIDIAESTQNVIVTAELRPDTAEYLTDQSRFWVVRARVAAGKVTGLETLLSGAYIAMDPSRKGERTRSFKGLENPPAVTSYERGRHFTLTSHTLGSLGIGDPIYYRRINVGQLASYKLEENGDSVTLDIFVREPYVSLVHANSRFWNASGLDISLTASGLEIQTESLVSIVLGGLAFDTPPDAKPGPAPAKDQIFTLYSDRESAFSPAYSERNYYYLYFKDSVRGLSVGAPVDLLGIQIGEVKAIQLEVDLETLDLRIPVLVEIEPERIVNTGKEEYSPRENVEILVKQGLRAQLAVGNLLTGQQLVSLAFHPDAEPATLGHRGEYLVFPTLPTPLGELKASLTELMKKVAALPLDQIGDDLRDTLAGLNRIVNSGELKAVLNDLSGTLRQTEALAQALNTSSLPVLNQTLTEAQRTVADVRSLVSSESPLYTEVVRTLRELSEAARSIRVMADYLERHPEALISGKRGQR